MAGPTTTPAAKTPAAKPAAPVKRRTRTTAAQRTVKQRKRATATRARSGLSTPATSSSSEISGLKALVTHQADLETAILSLAAGYGSPQAATTGWASDGDGGDDGAVNAVNDDGVTGITLAEISGLLADRERFGYVRGRSHGAGAMRTQMQRRARLEQSEAVAGVVLRTVQELTPILKLLATGTPAGKRDAVKALTAFTADLGRSHEKLTEEMLSR